MTLDEQALDGAQIRFNATQAQEAPLEVLPTGVLHIPDIGLSVQNFPADNGLPALSACCDTSSHSQLFAALQTAARLQLQDPTWTLTGAYAEPVRYKPANRCVIRYHLQLTQLSHQAEQIQRTLTLFGKVYTKPAQAHSVQALQQDLYEEQIASEETPFLPHPLGLIDSLGLTLNEAIQVTHTQSQADEPWNRLRTGGQALRPQVELGRDGTVAQVSIPTEELRLTAQALARLHHSSTRPSENAPRTGTKEAKRARERAALIAARNPTQAEQVQQCVQQLVSLLESLQPARYLPAHGGFKSSQLLFHSHHVYVVDFDGFCLADPALDVGYFLAYLRPSGLWYHKPGMRQWFEEAATVFRKTYRQEMLTRGTTQEIVEGILERTQLYEAALLFKIATRRINRLNSPRPQELSAMLAEITLCLAQK